MIDDGSATCVQDPEYQVCMAASDTCWDEWSNPPSCQCQDSNAYWIGSECYNQQKEDCENANGTWNGGSCDYGCSNYSDQNSCELNSNYSCWWDEGFGTCN